MIKSVKVMFKNVYRYISYLCVCILQGVVICLPRRGILVLGRIAGVACFYILGKERRKAISHLNKVYGSRKDNVLIAKNVFKHLGMNFFEWLWMPRLNAKNIRKIVNCVGIEKVKSALDNEKGIIMLTAHFGNWEYLAAFFGLQGYKSAAIGKRIYYSKYNDFIVKMRNLVGVSTVYRDGSTRQMLRVLKGNGLLGVLPDQDVGKIEGVFVDFFKRPTFTPSGPVALALASGAPIIPCFVVRDGNGHRIEICDPIKLEKTSSKEETIKQNTQKWSWVVEGYINKYPSQWVWIHRRWKTKEKVKTEEVSCKQKEKLKGKAAYNVLLGYSILIACFVFSMCIYLPCFAYAQEQNMSSMVEEIEGFTMTLVDKKGLDKASVNGSVANILPGGLIEIYDVVARIFKPRPGEPDIIIHTEKGLYNRNENFVNTDEFVRINHMDIVITGDGLVWEPDKTEVKIKKNVRVEYHTPREIVEDPGVEAPPRDDDPVTVITARGSGKMDYSNKTAFFKKNVIVKDFQAILKADRMKVYFDEEQGIVQKVEGYGNVKIKQPNRESSSRKAEYFVALDKIILTGDPRIAQGSDLYTSDKIIIFDKGNRVVFEPRAQLVIYSKGESDRL